ncbi:anhydro-N-acetylmuramic acid kinase [bacterium]|nr:anhydro-N-acetylmuramic acid kinase [bacterium]
MTTYNIIGVMSGTSMDGLDIAHVSLTEQEPGKWDYKINKAVTIPYGDKWRLRLSKLRHQNSLIFYKTDRYYGQFIGENIRNFMEEHNLEADLIASHGHTVFHQPENNLTVQVGDGNSIYAQTGVPTVTNFRALDVVRGGEGAPLVALADHYLFSEFDMCLNLGGFANISANISGVRIAYDISPCNIVLNRIAREFDQEYDEDGAIAERGQIDYDLLADLNDIPFYSQEPPKSLGREWISKNFWSFVRNSTASKEDRMKTLCDHIAQQIGDNVYDLASTEPAGKRVFITGGGAFNKTLIEHLRSHTEAEIVIPEDDVVNYKEALSFALLGILRVKNEINILANATGASENSVSGALYGDFSKLN